MPRGLRLPEFGEIPMDGGSVLGRPSPAQQQGEPLSEVTQKSPGRRILMNSRERKCERQALAACLLGLVKPPEQGVCDGQEFITEPSLGLSLPQGQVAPLRRF